MAKSTRTLAREQVIQAAEAAQDALSAGGIAFTPLDIVKIAADYAAKHAVLSTQFGSSESQRDLAKQLRSEFVRRITYWEDICLNGGEPVQISKDPPTAVRSIELVDLMLAPPAKKRGRPHRT
ncbi:hypothetical protein ACLIMP_18200 [Novosphingobium aerophilum]|uniref:hypothetical protein n=1 Tax=Novosphingobium aerophilum TaxID=2839843 RepID=UPI003FD4E66D